MTPHSEEYWEGYAAGCADTREELVRDYIAMRDELQSRMRAFELQSLEQRDAIVAFAVKMAMMERHLASNRPMQ